MRNSPSLRLVWKRNKPSKVPFIVTKKGIVVAVRWSAKHFFAPNSPIFQKNEAEKQKNMEKGNCKTLCKALCFLSKRNKT